MDIARYVRENKDPSKFSNEFKVIEKLTRVGFLKKVLKPHIAERLSKACEEYEFAKSEHRDYEIYCQTEISNRRTNNSNSSSGRTETPATTELSEIRSQLADDFEKLLSVEEKKTFDNKYDKVISTYEQLEHMKSKIVGYDGSTSKSKAWGYVLTFRGFLLYLYNESNVEETKNELQSIRAPTTGKRKKEKEKMPLSFTAMRQERVNNIHKVLQNPVVLEEAPFLKDWERFEEHGFGVINLLLQIAKELESQLHMTTTTAAHNYYLLERASKRYFTELENHFWYVLDSALYIFHLKDVGTEKFEELEAVRNNYRQNVMIPLLSEFISNDREFIKYYQRECDSFNNRHANQRQ